MTIKIHGLAYAVCTQRVLMTLIEKEVTDYEVVPVILNKNEHKTAEYMNMQVSQLVTNCCR
jgi:glutathione S-transferase